MINRNEQLKYEVATSNWVKLFFIKHFRKLFYWSLDRKFDKYIEFIKHG